MEEIERKIENFSRNIVIRTTALDLSFRKVPKSGNARKNWSGSAFTIASSEAYIFTSCLLRACHDLCLFFSYTYLSLSLSLCSVSSVLQQKSVRAFRTSSFIWRVSFIHLPWQRYTVWSIFVFSSYCLENCCCCCSRDNDFHRGNGVFFLGERFQGLG